MKQQLLEERIKALKETIEEMGELIHTLSGGGSRTKTPVNDSKNMTIEEVFNDLSEYSDAVGDHLVFYRFEEAVNKLAANGL
jgi:hypothetical protein